MKRSRFSKVTIYVNVLNRSELIRHARANAQAHGVRTGIIVSYRDALLWLLNPDENPPGCDILDSSVE